MTHRVIHKTRGILACPVDNPVRLEGAWSLLRDLVTSRRSLQLGRLGRAGSVVRAPEGGPRITGAAICAAEGTQAEEGKALTRRRKPAHAGHPLP